MDSKDAEDIGQQIEDMGYQSEEPEVSAEEARAQFILPIRHRAGPVCLEKICISGDNFTSEASLKAPVTMPDVTADQDVDMVENGSRRKRPISGAFEGVQNEDVHPKNLTFPTYPGENDSGNLQHYNQRLAIVNLRRWFKKNGKIVDDQDLPPNTTPAYYYQYLPGSGDEKEGYVDFFISSRGNEYFCEIDEEYLTDRFNLTGLNTEVQYYQYALDLVTDVFDLDCEDDMREQIEKSARHLYGLVHARYIVTTRGLAKMVDKYKKADFGKCPRVLCDAHPLLPMGLSDVAASKSVKLFCAKCEDIYNPKSSRHAAIDGAYFGSSFHNILFQVYPALIPEKSRRRYEPKIFGFRVHAASALARWQDGERRSMKRRLGERRGECVAVEGTGVGFIEDRDGRTDSDLDEEMSGDGEDELGLRRDA